MGGAFAVGGWRHFYRKEKRREGEDSLVVFRLVLRDISERGFWNLRGKEKVIKTLERKNGRVRVFFGGILELGKQGKSEKNFIKEERESESFLWGVAGFGVFFGELFPLA